MGLFGLSKTNVEAMKARRDVAGLMQVMLTHKEESLRIEAARALGDIGDSMAVPALGAIIRNLGNYNNQVLYGPNNNVLPLTAAASLIKIGGNPAVLQLVQVLEEGYAPGYEPVVVKKLAVWTLVGMNSDFAAVALAYSALENGYDTGASFNTMAEFKFTRGLELLKALALLNRPDSPAEMAELAKSFNPGTIENLKTFLRYKYARDLEMYRRRSQGINYQKVNMTYEEWASESSSPPRSHSPVPEIPRYQYTKQRAADLIARMSK